jgi:hypothetical protein
MISSCPHCKQTLKLGDAQQAKLKKALDALEPGKKLTIKCPSCNKGISLDSKDMASTGCVKPPAPPDLSWLKEGNLQDDKIGDVPMALVLYPQNEKLEIVRDALEQVGYQIIVAENVEQAMERMRFVSFACVVLHSKFDGPNLEESSFHKYMRDMTMQRRRYLFYILIGPEFHTLYNLQALAYSANLVINEEDLYHMGVAMRKAIPQYEEVFGPFMEELASSGKS